MPITFEQCRSDIAAEARAKIVSERLINFTTDAGTIDALQFLMTREIAHTKAFTAALESMNKPRFSIGRNPPTPGPVDQFFNDSTGAGEDGESTRAVRAKRWRRMESGWGARLPGIAFIPRRRRRY
jgi:Mn-containing catalase